MPTRKGYVMASQGWPARAAARRHCGLYKGRAVAPSTSTLQYLLVLVLILAPVQPHRELQNVL